jgi:hypothetical protein
MAAEKAGSAAKRTAFLRRLAETGNISAAARHAGVSRSAVYAWRAGDAGFAASWLDAEQEAVDALEQEARRRAVDGVEQPILSGGKFVRHDDGSIATIRHYSDRLLEFLLKARRPETYGSRAETKEGGRDGGEGALTDEERAQRVARLLDAARARGARPDSDA